MVRLSQIIYLFFCQVFISTKKTDRFYGTADCVSFVAFPVIQLVSSSGFDKAMCYIKKNILVYML